MDNVREEAEPLLHETVWMQQPVFEEAEALFVRLSLREKEDDDGDIIDSDEATDEHYSPLQQETVWFSQQQYETAEAKYFMLLAGVVTPHSTPAPGTPSKRLHHQDDRSQVKKHKVEGRGTADFLDKKLQAEVAHLSKTTKSIMGKLEEFEKMQQRKAQVVRDSASRLVAAIEACQTKLNEELAQSTAQINSFRSLLDEVETVAKVTNDSLGSEKWGRFKTHEGYCQSMSERLAKLDAELNSCMDLYQFVQTDTLKSDINQMVGDIGKLSLSKARSGNDQFRAKKESLIKTVKNLLNDGRTALVTSQRSSSPGDSDGSLEGYGSLSSDASEDQVRVNGRRAAKANPKPMKGREKKSKKAMQNGRPGSARANRNNNSSVGLGNKAAQNSKAKAASSSARQSKSQISPHVPTKRNAQGVQNPAQKKQDLFKFKGATQSPASPFQNQPGILGPRPDLFPMRGTNQQTPYGYSNFSAVRHKQPYAQPQSQSVRPQNPPLTSHRHGLTNVNFNFSGPRPHELNGAGMLQNSALMGANLNVPYHGNNPRGSNFSNPLKQSKLFQHQKSQSKGTGGTDQQYGMQHMQPGFSFQTSPGGQSFLPTSQASLMNNPCMTMGPGNMEQQLNEISQKLQQMQLAASQNFQLQQLVQETERLKQLVAHKQHQQQDRFQQQFHLLINAFLQQQQQQQAQGPQSKMARPMQFHGSQKQQQRIINARQLQQQKKQKQQQNKVQQVRQGEQPRDDSTPMRKQESLSHQNRMREASPQNPQSSFSNFPKRKPLNKNSKAVRLGTFSPQAHGDRRKAGVSSIVVLENLSCLVLVDIINGCLKLYEICPSSSTNEYLDHQLITRLELPRPYYMSLLTKDTVVVSREGKLLSLVKVSKKRLEFLQDVRSESQYYGLAHVDDNVIACAAFADQKIDVVKIEDGTACTTCLTVPNVGPELLSTVPSTKSVLYLERMPAGVVRLISISQQGSQEYAVCVGSNPSDVCNMATFGGKILCSNKQTNKLTLLSTEGNVLGDLAFSPGAITQPFAMAFSSVGKLYIANDGAWDSEFEHFITTEICAFIFT